MQNPQISPPASLQHFDIWQFQTADDNAGAWKQGPAHRYG
jgi:hypothetical protein